MLWRTARPAFAMPKRHNHLIERIASMDNLRAAYAKTARGKRLSWGFLEFKEYADKNLRAIREQLLDGAWEQGRYREFMVHEPKPRLISALDFKDRLAQHAVCNVIGPIFEAGLLPYTFACRAGMGTHAGVRHIQAALRRTQATHFLKTDYRKFFPSIDRARLHYLIQRKIKCAGTLATIRAMVPPTGYGLPIGSLTSQLFANVYADVIDRHMHFDLGARHWARYMDDIVILSSNPYELRHWFESIEQTSRERLGLGISKWQVAPVARGINFLGFRIWPRHKLLRKQSVISAKRKIARYAQNGQPALLASFIASWRGHAGHADTCNLYNHLENRHGIALRH
jgi:retron-type reverse transcriptase